MDTSSLHKVTCCGKLGNTAVFEFGSPEPVESLFGTKLRVTEGVKLLDGIRTAGHTLEIDIESGRGLWRGYVVSGEVTGHRLGENAALVADSECKESCTSSCVVTDLARAQHYPINNVERWAFFAP